MARFADFDPAEQRSLQSALSHPDLPAEIGSRVEKMLGELEQEIAKPDLVQEAKRFVEEQARKAGVTSEEMIERILREWSPKLSVDPLAS